MGSLGLPAWLTLPQAMEGLRDEPKQRLRRRLLLVQFHVIACNFHDDGLFIPQPGWRSSGSSTSRQRRFHDRLNISRDDFVESRRNLCMHCDHCWL